MVEHESHKLGTEDRNLSSLPMWYVETNNLNPRVRPKDWQVIFHFHREFSAHIAVIENGARLRCKVCGEMVPDAIRMMARLKHSPL